MTPNTKKTILIAVLGIALIGGAVGYYYYNKGPLDVKNASGIKIASNQLYQSYSRDTLLSKKQYTNQVIEATGVVDKISQNQQNQAIVLLKTDENGAYVNCTMEGPALDIREKESITLKGICTGIGMGDADLGILGDVYLVRCYQVK